jgi:hypothetical protein
MLKKLLLASALILAPVAAIAQLWPAFPIVGGQSYCASTGNAGVCTQTVPVGPAMTGNETVPADTNLTSGGGIQTVKVPIVELGAGKTVVVTSLTGDTVTVDAQTRQLIETPAGTLSTLTINLPAASSTMVTGQRIGICGTQIVTTLTMGAGTGNTFSTTAPTAMLVPVATGAASCFEFVYVKTSATVGVWHRTQ